MTAVDAGALVVWARPAAVSGKSELLATLLDADGSPRGIPTVLRTTSGGVVAVAVHRKDGHAWLAWSSTLAGSSHPRMLVAASRLAVDLSSISTPVTIGQFASDEISDDLRVLALADGGAAVASAWSTTRCKDVATGDSTQCTGYALHWVGDDGSVRRAAHFGVDGGDGAMGSIVDVGTGVLVDAFAWHGGFTSGDAFARYGEESEPSPFEVVHCRPPMIRAWTGSELVTLCDGDEADERERCPITGEDGLCSRVHAVRLDGDEVTPASRETIIGAPQISLRTRCKDGHPVLEVGWRGGKLVLDPQAPGSSTEALAVGTWTGKLALHTDDRGTIVRERCTSAGRIVSAGEAPAIAYQHPSKASRRPSIVALAD
jgi:hypothetical protein